MPKLPFGYNIVLSEAIVDKQGRPSFRLISARVEEYLAFHPLKWEELKRQFANCRLIAGSSCEDENSAKAS